MQSIHCSHIVKLTFLSQSALTYRNSKYHQVLKIGTLMHSRNFFVFFYILLFFIVFFPEMINNLTFAQIIVFLFFPQSLVGFGHFFHYVFLLNSRTYSYSYNCNRILYSWIGKLDVLMWSLDLWRKLTIVRSSAWR